MKIAILAPFTIVKEFHYPLVAIAKKLKENGFEIIMIHCRQVMQKDCTAMYAKGLHYGYDDLKRKTLCDDCLKSASLSAKLYPWKTIWLEPKKTSEPEIYTDLPTNLICKKELRKISGYEVVVNKKIHKKSRDKDIIKAWNERYLALRSVQSQAVKILMNEKLDALISYNNLYGIHQLFHRLCARLKIKSLCLHQSFHMLKKDEYILFENTISDFLNRIRIEANQKKKSDKKNKSIIRKHLQGLFESKKPWAYSKPKSENKLTKRRGKTKVLIALSSPDEVAGFQLLDLLPKIKNPFNNQIIWLKWVFKLAKRFPEVTFYVRPHPRLYPNKRESTLSEFAESLEKLRDINRPKNIDWPNQQMQKSIWDHLHDTNVLFNAWSSIAEIFSYYKIPSLTFFPKFSNTQKVLGFTSTNQEQYEKAFVKAIHQSDPRQVKEEAFRWLSCLLTKNTFSLDWKDNYISKVLKKITPKKYIDYIEIGMFSTSTILENKNVLTTIIKNEIQR